MRTTFQANLQTFATPLFAANQGHNQIALSLLEREGRDVYPESLTHSFLESHHREAQQLMSKILLSRQLLAAVFGLVA
ncbi:MAG: hypothetical protein ACKO0V_02020, partial [bacterium]